MNSEQNILLSAVQELRQSVQDLSAAVEREYPKRAEVEDRFTTKESAKRRFLLFIVIVIVSLSASYFVTISTVSACFLDRPPHVDACGLIPGFEESEDRGAILLKRFAQNEELLLQQERRLNRIEKLLERQPRR